MTELPRQPSHTLQMRKYDFSFQVDTGLREKYLLDGRGNFVADCYCRVEGRYDSEFSDGL